MTDTSGPSSSAPFAFYDPDSHSLRTSQATLLSDSTSSSPTLPPSGSMSSGRLYERPTLAPVTADLDCSSSLPTPKRSDGAARAGDPERWKGSKSMNGRWSNLVDAAMHFLPTPAAQEPGGTLEQYHARLKKADGRDSTFAPLGMLVQTLLPTPAARDWKDTGDLTGMHRRTRDGRPRPISDDTLPVRMSRLLPTPTAGDSKAATNKTAGRSNPNSKHHDGTTLTDWVRLPGATTSPPSDGTKPCSDDPHQLRLTLEGDCHPDLSSG